jgi:hypothetical protein
MFGLSGEQLNQLLEGCTFMFEQFTYNVAKPPAVVTALEKAGFTEEHAGAVSAVWVAEAEPLLKRVQNEQFGPRTLDSISWSLNLQSSEDTQGRMSKPTAIMGKFSCAICRCVRSLGLFLTECVCVYRAGAQGGGCIHGRIVRCGAHCD